MMTFERGGDQERLAGVFAGGTETGSSLLSTLQPLKRPSKRTDVFTLQSGSSVVFSDSAFHTFVRLTGGREAGFGQTIA